MRLKMENDALYIRLNPLEIALSQHGPFHISYGNITGASTEKPERDWGQIRAPGTHIPFLIKAGTYHGRQGREFWYATIGMPYIVIGLRAWDFDRIVMTMSDTDAWAARINEKIENMA